MITVQNATPEMFEDVHSLLLGFVNPGMGKEDWRRMLLQYPCKALRAPALAVDSRFAEEAAPLGLSFRVKTSRLYRPAHGALRPAHVDGLYSEQMGLRQ
jgi:hypothetical protein